MAVTLTDPYAPFGTMLVTDPAAFSWSLSIADDSGDVSVFTNTAAIASLSPVGG